MVVTGRPSPLHHSLLLSMGIRTIDYNQGINYNLLARKIVSCTELFSYC